MTKNRKRRETSKHPSTPSTPTTTATGRPHKQTSTTSRTQTYTPLMMIVGQCHRLMHRYARGDRSVVRAFHQSTSQAFPRQRSHKRTTGRMDLNSRGTSLKDDMQARMVGDHDDGDTSSMFVHKDERMVAPGDAAAIKAMLNKVFASDTTSTTATTTTDTTTKPKWLESMERQAQASDASSTPSLTKAYKAGTLPDWEDSRLLTEIAVTLPEVLSFICTIDPAQEERLKVLDVASKSDVYEAMVIVELATTKAALIMMKSLKRQFKHRKIDQLVGTTQSFYVDGADGNDWLMLDFGHFAVHCMTPEARETYDLEGLWEKEVQLEHQTFNDAAYQKMKESARVYSLNLGNDIE